MAGVHIPGSLAHDSMWVCWCMPGSKDGTRFASGRQLETGWQSMLVGGGQEYTA